MANIKGKLASNSLLARNMMLNIIGLAIPIAAGIFSIPILINSLGADGFGFLSLAWIVTGYFGLLDLGVGRSLTAMISERIGNDDIDDLPLLIWSALTLSGLIGLFGGVLLGFIAPTLVDDLFEVPLHLRDQAERSFRILALSIPPVIISSALSGVLVSYQRFDLVNLVRAPVGSLTFMGPVLALQFSNKLSDIVGALVSAKILECFINIFICIRVIPAFKTNIRVSCKHLTAMLRFGGWISVSNIISPALIYLDRF